MKVKELASAGHLLRTQSHQARHGSGWVSRYPTTEHISGWHVWKHVWQAYMIHGND
jgi:hypothetical protein